jgi:radical SAM protein with 4Fe4S-binding SPASM domain
MPLHLPGSDEAFSVFLKLPGKTCNLNCHYCYEKRRPYRQFSMLGPELLRSFLQKASGRALLLELHGGEPLMIGKERMRPLLAECRAYTGPLRLALQTNGTLLDQEWIDLFMEDFPSIEVAVSLDGDPISNQHRVDYRDEASHADVERALRLLEDNRLPFGIACVVARPALTRVQEILDYFAQFSSINLLKLNPCLDYSVRLPEGRDNRPSLSLQNASEAGAPGWALTPLEFAAFLAQIFDAWVDGGLYQTLPIEPFMSIIRVLGGARANFCVYDEQKCANMLTLYPDGTIGSCDELRMPTAKLAHIDDFETLDQISHFQTNPLLHSSLNMVLEKCSTCEYQPTCHGGCLATRLHYFGTPYYEDYCTYRKNVIDHVRARLGSAAQSTNAA